MAQPSGLPHWGCTDWQWLGVRPKRTDEGKSIRTSSQKAFRWAAAQNPSLPPGMLGQPRANGSSSVRKGKGVREKGKGSEALKFGSLTSFSFSYSYSSSRKRLKVLLDPASSSSSSSNSSSILQRVEVSRPPRKEKIIQRFRRYRRFLRKIKG